MVRSFVRQSRLTLVVVLGFVRSGYSQEPAVLPPAANGIVERMEKEIKVSKVRAIRDLDKVLKDTTKSGDLAGAVAIKAVMDRLKAETQASSGGAAMAAYAGKWRTESALFSLLGNGTAMNLDYPDVVGKWSADGKELRLQWSHGIVFEMSAAGEGLSGVRIDQQGKRSTSKWTRQ